MSTDAAFLAAIAANPQDHLPKLVYADWLEEQGDARAELVRVQHALVNSTLSDLEGEGWWGLRARYAALVATFDASWVNAASQGLRLEWIERLRAKGDVLRFFQELAESGDPAAMTKLAFHFWNIQGVQHDYPNARRWLERAVDAGYAPAMYALGLLNKAGLGLWWWQRPKKAADLFRRSSDLGYAPAMVELAKMYAAGDGTRQNTPEAIRLYRLAAEAGEGEAHRHLGNRYRDGRGVPRDVTEAVKHYRRAIELGEEEAREPLRQLLWEQPENWPKNQ